MFKFLCVALLAIGLSNETVLKTPSFRPNVDISTVAATRSDFWSKWGPDLMEYLELIDVEKVAGVLVQHLTDPEVLKFLDFLFGSQFKEVVFEFESMEEFKEAYKFLAAKGYDVESVMNFINSGLNLPPFEKPNLPLWKGSGLTGLMEDLIAVLPLEDIKKLFESKLESNPDLAELFDTINSEEFLDILKRMAQNPKFTEIKNIFESYGFDFKFFCDFAKEFFGEHYQGIFCK